MEVRDRIPGVYESPIYDMNLHYEYSLKLSRYTFATNGKMTIHKNKKTNIIFVDTFLTLNNDRNETTIRKP